MNNASGNSRCLFVFCFIIIFSILIESAKISKKSFEFKQGIFYLFLFFDQKGIPVFSTGRFFFCLSRYWSKISWDRAGYSLRCLSPKNTLDAKARQVCSLHFLQLDLSRSLNTSMALANSVIWAPVFHGIRHSLTKDYNHKLKKNLPVDESGLPRIPSRISPVFKITAIIEIRHTP